VSALAALWVKMGYPSAALRVSRPTVLVFACTSWRFSWSLEPCYNDSMRRVLVEVEKRTSFALAVRTRGSVPSTSDAWFLINETMRRRVYFFPSETFLLWRLRRKHPSVWKTATHGAVLTSTSDTNSTDGVGSKRLLLQAGATEQVESEWKQKTKRKERLVPRIKY